MTTYRFPFFSAWCLGLALGACCGAGSFEQPVQAQTVRVGNRTSKPQALQGRLNHQPKNGGLLCVPDLP